MEGLDICLLELKCPSDQSYDAVAHAISLMRKKKDYLVIVHIMKYPPWTSKDAIDALRKKGEEVLKTCSAKATEHKVRVCYNSNFVYYFENILKFIQAKHTTHLIEAEDVREEMIKLARFHGADYLVVGSRGLGKLGSVVLGSTSDYLAHHAPCPVILVRKKTLKDPY